MVDKIIEDYYAGEKIRNKKRGKDSYFTKQGMEAVILSDYAKETLSELLTYPQNFELYQEPEKTWVDNKEFPYNFSDLCCLEVGRNTAILFARELMKRLSDRYPVNATIAPYNVTTILAELVGEENLK